LFTTTSSSSTLGLSWSLSDALSFSWSIFK
jgi:hypothetical protein